MSEKMSRNFKSCFWRNLCRGWEWGACGIGFLEYMVMMANLGFTQGTLCEKRTVNSGHEYFMYLHMHRIAFLFKLKLSQWLNGYLNKQDFH